MKMMQRVCALLVLLLYHSIYICGCANEEIMYWPIHLNGSLSTSYNKANALSYISSNDGILRSTYTNFDASIPEELHSSISSIEITWIPKFPFNVSSTTFDNIIAQSSKFAVIQSPGIHLRIYLNQSDINDLNTQEGLSLIQNDLEKFLQHHILSNDTYTLIREQGPRSFVLGPCSANDWIMMNSRFFSSNSYSKDIQLCLSSSWVLDVSENNLFQDGMVQTNEEHWLQFVKLTNLKSRLHALYLQRWKDEKIKLDRIKSFGEKQAIFTSRMISVVINKKYSSPTTVDAHKVNHPESIYEVQLIDIAISDNIQSKDLMKYYFTTLATQDIYIFSGIESTKSPSSTTIYRKKVITTKNSYELINESVRFHVNSGVGNTNGCDSNSTILCTRDYKFAGEGFHRTLEFRIAISMDIIEKKCVKANCVALVILPLSKDTYADLDELRRLGLFYDFQVISMTKHIEIERPAFVSSQHRIALSYKLSKPTHQEQVLDVLNKDIKIPFHLRYQTPSKTTAYRNISLIKPDVWFIYEAPGWEADKNNNHAPNNSLSGLQEFLFPENAPQIFGWRLLCSSNCLNDELFVPIGMQHHGKMVGFITLGTTILGAIIISFVVLRRNVANHEGEESHDTTSTHK